jgi:hypothetical protein
VDLMLVLTLGDKPALRSNQQYAVRRNNQLDSRVGSEPRTFGQRVGFIPAA